MKIQLRLFSIARELAGSPELELELDDHAIASAVLERLIERNPQFRQWKPSLRIAVNRHYVGVDHVLRDGDEVAIIPPVSGG